MNSKALKILTIGDIVGNSGRNAVLEKLPALKNKLKVDFIIANGENSAGGFGITPEISSKLLDAGVDIITTGNHIWRQNGIKEYVERENRILRPANYPDLVPGKGYGIYNCNGVKVCVINLIGRIFMETADCPFICADKIINEVLKLTNIIIIDFHAEATSEKNAIAWYLDGRASCVFGTHTHVQTADERILPGGTSYITDLGMSGSRDSVIGMERESIIQRFITGLPAKYEVAKNNVYIEGAYIEIDIKSGKSVKIIRIQEKI